MKKYEEYEVIKYGRCRRGTYGLDTNKGHKNWRHSPVERGYAFMVHRM